MLPRASAGGVVVNAERKVLVVHQHSNSWSLPKGGIEEGESELEAAKREIAEETGITELTLVVNLGSYERYSIAKDGIHEELELGLRKRTIFLFTTPQMLLTPQDTEVTEARWVTLNEAIVLLTHPKDKEFLESRRKYIEDAVT